MGCSKRSCGNGRARGKSFPCPKLELALPLWSLLLKGFLSNSVRSFRWEIDYVPQRLLLASALGLSVFLALLGLPRSYANPQPSEIPAWLKAHIGIGEGQIAPV